MRASDILSVGDRIASGHYEADRRYRRAVNYCDGTHRLSLVHESAGPGPDRLVVAAEAWNRWYGAAPSIHVSRRYIRVWNRRFAKRRLPICRSRVPRATWNEAALSALEELLRREAPPESLAQLLAGCQPPTHSFDGALCEHVAREMRVLTSCLQSGLAMNTRGHAKRAARRIAGCGRGLTPSGDDFLAGISLAVYAGMPKDRAAVWPIIMQSALRATSGLSAHFLALAAHGRAPDAWRHMLAALRDENSEAMTAWARRILNWGATSGADMLAGFVVAARAFVVLPGEE